MSNPGRILIVRLGAMGDIIHTLPVLSALRARFPSAEIDWLVEPRHAALLALVPGLRSIVVDTRQWSGPRGVMGVLGLLRRRHYDLAIDAQGLLKSAVLARASGASIVIGFTRRHAREGAAALWYSTRVDPGPATHVIDKNLALARAAGADTPSREIVLTVPDLRHAVAEAISAAGAAFAILNPGGGWPNKRWPADRFGTLAAELGALGIRSLVLWGPGEEALARAVVSAAPATSVMVPETTLADLVAIVARAAIIVSGDTGPLHIACALGVPVVGIYGPTRPERNGPWSPQDLAVSRCDVCECHHLRRCKASRWCLEDVGVEEVKTAVLRRLERVRAFEAEQ